MSDQVALIKVRTYAQKALIEQELLGQFSDGHWENADNYSWKYYYRMVAVSKKHGVWFDGPIPVNYKGYDTTDKWVWKGLNKRMLLFARYAFHYNTGYIREDVMWIIRNISEKKIADSKRESTIRAWPLVVKFLRFRRDFDLTEFCNAMTSKEYTSAHLKKDLNQIAETLAKPISV
jgi:hypothetical protein